MSERKKIVAGNWKMNLQYEEAMNLISEIVPMCEAEVNSEVSLVVIPSFPHLYPVGKIIGKHSKIALGAQNCDFRASGAYTGEVSAEMLKSYHADYVLVGHSERRQYFGENDEILSQKVRAVLRAGMKPIYCVGETLEVRNAGEYKKMIESQLENVVFSLSEEEFEKIVIAYEPVWAIGTGVTATSEQAQEVHAFIREEILRVFGEMTAQKTTILYGGSCKASNAKELFSQKDIDGGLIGGAALQSREFIEIAKSF